MLIVITFFSRVRYFSAFFQKGNYLSAELCTTSFPLFFSLLSVVGTGVILQSLSTGLDTLGVDCPLRNRRCAKLNFSPLFRFFFFRLRREGRTALSLEETVHKAWSKGTQKWLPHSFPHACLLVTPARIEEVFQRVHCFSHLHHGAIAYTRMAMKSVDHCRLMRRNAGK